MSVAVILGSAFSEPLVAAETLVAETVDTGFGAVCLYRWSGRADGGYVLFRHGVPHRWLPHQIPYRAHAAALAAVECEALLITSSVGVLDESLPLFQPLLIDDLLMPDNRMPDGSTCTMFVERSEEQGHLVLEEGLFSPGLAGQVEAAAEAVGWQVRERVVFAYAGGPRTKTAAENRWLRLVGAQVNSMTVGPEVVLANELGIATAAVAVGHKRSGEVVAAGADRSALAESLRQSRAATEELALQFLRDATAVPFGNKIYKY